MDDPDVSYTVILVEGEQLPLAVVRRTGRREEAFTHTLRWEPSDLLSRVPAEPTWTARPAEAGYANGFLVELVREVRARQHLSEFADFKYFAVFRTAVDVLDLGLAHMLVRRPEFHGDQEYAGHHMWEDTDALHDIDRGEDMRREYVAISADEAAALKQRIDTRWENEVLRYHVVRIGGTPFAVAGVPRNPHSAVGPVMFNGEGGFVRGDLLSQVADAPRCSVEEVPLDHAVSVMSALVEFQRHRSRAELTGGHAVFAHHQDRLDLDSAYALVQTPEPHHRYVLPLSHAEAHHLHLRLTMRAARRAARPVDGHYYFAVLASLRDAAEPDRAFSLIRCPADAAPRWELFLRPGEWLPTSSPLTLVTLPIGAEQVERITAALAGRTRHLQIVNGEPGFLRIVRWTPASEETREGPDGPWQPCYLIGRWRDEPTWTITEPGWPVER
ncbi:hypothetical protein ADL03_19135 [Nocardia sp. NRRL S-836]|nr:hypothetical protein ADL03_19135 [Nocardia sp. NRRL S-836]